MLWRQAGDGPAGRRAGRREGPTTRVSSTGGRTVSPSKARAVQTEPGGRWSANIESSRSSLPSHWEDDGDRRGHRSGLSSHSVGRLYGLDSERTDLASNLPFAGRTAKRRCFQTIGEPCVACKAMHIACTFLEPPNKRKRSSIPPTGSTHDLTTKAVPVRTRPKTEAETDGIGLTRMGEAGPGPQTKALRAKGMAAAEASASQSTDNRSPAGASTSGTGGGARPAKVGASRVSRYLHLVLDSSSDAGLTLLTLTLRL